MGEEQQRGNSCDGNFSNAGDYGIGGSPNTNVNRKSCGICGMTPSNPTRHAVLHTNWGEVHCCEICGKEYGRKAHLIRHKRLHNNKKPYLCSVCHRGFNYKQSLDGHMRTHTGERPYVCETCGKTSSHQSWMILHRRTHTGEKPFNCKECGKSFRTPSLFKQHVDAHGGPYNCDTCGFEFLQSRYLETHKKTIHNGGVEVTFRTDEKGLLICEVCEEVFDSRPALTFHWLKHNQERMCVCKTCGKQVTKEGLKSHTFRMHGNQKHPKTGTRKPTPRRFTCSYPGCGKRYLNSSGLHYHKFSHSGERPETCKFCQKTFRTKGDIKIHFKSAHAQGEKPSCASCGRIFSMRSKRFKNQNAKCGRCAAEGRVQISKVKVEVQLDYEPQKRRTNVPAPAPAKCERCDKTFYSNYYKKIHSCQPQTGETNDKKCRNEKDASSQPVTIKEEMVSDNLQELNHGTFVFKINGSDIEVLGNNA